MTYKFLSHTADVKFQAQGKTLKKAFEQAALALRETIAGKEKIKNSAEKTITAKGKDNESLLYNFLEEFLFLLDAKDFILSEVKDVKIMKDKKQLILKASVSGDKASKYKFTNDVKAVTYSGMFVKKQKDKYTVQVVLDV